MIDKNALLALSIGQIVIGTLLFLWFASMGKKRPREDQNNPPGDPTFEILQRNGRTTAIQKSPTFRWWPGVLYAGGFYFVAPFLIWRYGLLKTVFLIALPIATGAPIAVSIGGPAGFGMGLFIALILRGWIGVFLAKKDIAFYRSTLIRRGWHSAGYQMARNGKRAIKQFRSA